MWKSESIRLGLRIFTAKGNEKIRGAQRLEQRSVRGAFTPSASVYPTQKLGLSQNPLFGFWAAPLHKESWKEVYLGLDSGRL
ncbi:hypothetical protein J7E73_25545 [Paenibacillus albidus]|uniref:hypothetical protein n=1 Tax=Paenibacillus albidus TaxID=2041023 RepID=UPI001BEC7E49|nr:hypothetical protein [Paenibacillus albidus]MBT2292436.1 hypothetical protein [Paenibacillus albidus]